MYVLCGKESSSSQIIWQLMNLLAFCWVGIKPNFNHSSHRSVLRGTANYCVLTKKYIKYSSPDTHSSVDGLLTERKSISEIGTPKEWP